MTPNRSLNRIFIIFQKFFIPIPAKINFLTVLELIPKSDIYDSDSDSSKKRNHNTSSVNGANDEEGGSGKGLSARHFPPPTYIRTDRVSDATCQYEVEVIQLRLVLLQHHEKFIGLYNSLPLLSPKCTFRAYFHDQQCNVNMPIT